MLSTGPSSAVIGCSVIVGRWSRQREGGSRSWVGLWWWWLERSRWSSSGSSAGSISEDETDSSDAKERSSEGVEMLS